MNHSKQLLYALILALSMFGITACGAKEKIVIVEVTRIVPAGPVVTAVEATPPSPAQVVQPTAAIQPSVAPPSTPSVQSTASTTRRTFAFSWGNLFILSIYFISFSVAEFSALYSGKQGEQGGQNPIVGMYEQMGMKLPNVMNSQKDLSSVYGHMPGWYRRIMQVVGGLMVGSCMTIALLLIGFLVFVIYYAFKSQLTTHIGLILPRFLYWLPFGLLGLVTDLPFKIFHWEGRVRLAWSLSVWWLPRLVILLFLVNPFFLQGLNPTTTALAVLTASAILAAFFTWFYSTRERIGFREVQANYDSYAQQITRLVSFGNRASSDNLFGMRGEPLKWLLARYHVEHPDFDLQLDTTGTSLSCRSEDQLQELQRWWPSTAASMVDLENEPSVTFIHRAEALTHLVATALQFPLKPESQKADNRLISQVLQAQLLVKLPREFPVVCIQKSTFDSEDLDLLRHFLGAQMAADRFAIAFVFDQADQARELARQSLRLVYQWDVVMLGHTEVTNILMAKNKRQMLIKIVLSQVDLSVVSPFVVDGPTPDTMFVGRERELRQLITSIRSGQSISLAGGRKIGKTSILQKALRTLTETPEFVPLFLNCEPVMDYPSFFRTVDMYWKASGIFLPSTGEVTPDAFREAVLLKQRASGDRCLVLLMDEVDAILDFDLHNNELLFKVFRSLAQGGNCSFVFGGEKLLHRRSLDPNSPLFNFCTTTTLGYLNPQDVAKLVTEPMNYMGIEFAEYEETLRWIWQLSSGHPNIVQRICSILIKMMADQDSRMIRPSDIEAVGRSGSFQDAYIRTVWGRASDLERMITLLIPPGPITLDDVQRALASINVYPKPAEMKEAIDDLQLFSILSLNENYFQFMPAQFPVIARKAFDIPLELEAYRSEWLKGRTE